MTKFWLQVRGAYYTRVNSGNSLTFSSELVDGTKAVDIAAVTGVGPWAAAITASPQINRLGRTLSFRMEMNAVSYTGFEERVYFPVVADFLWAPTNDDRLTLSIMATGEQSGRAGGVIVRRSARQVVDTLLAMDNTVITVEFSDGSPTPATWNMFVEATEAVRKQTAEAKMGQDSYIVKLLCRRLS